MMSNKAGWIIFAGIMSMALTLIGTEMAELQGWADIYQIGFVAKAMVHLGTVAGAFAAGKFSE